MLEGTRILITGASGFIGGHTVRAVADSAGIPIPLIRRSSSRAALGPWADRARFADLRDPAGLHGALEGVDVVIHLAGLTRARREREFYAVNEEGTARLVRAVREAAPGLRRFVLVSSVSAAGPTVDGRPRRAEDPPAPVSPYGLSKAAGEQALRREAGDRIPWTIARPPIVYGPGERDVLQLFRMARRGLIPLLSGGTQRYSIVYGPDLAEGLVRLAVAPGAEGRAVFLCPQNAVSWRELAEAVAEAVGRRARMPSVPRLGAQMVALAGSLARQLTGRVPLLTLDKLPEVLAPEGWVVDPAPFEDLTGWACPTSLPEGLRRTAAWYREQGWIPAAEG